MKFCVFLCFFTFYFTSCHQKNDINNLSVNGDEDNINKGTILTHNFYNTVPYEYSFDSAFIIEVLVNKKKRRFLLDTGAPLSISKSLQEECNFTLFQETSLRDSNGDSSSVKIVTVSDLRIGEIQFQNIPALVFDVTAVPFECEKLDGIIGSNLLRLLIVQFNTLKSKIIFTDNINKLDLNPADAFDFYPNSTQSDPLVPVLIGKSTIDTCTFDTGDKSFYIISKRKKEIFNNNGLQSMHIIATGTGLGTMGLVGKTQFNTKTYLLSLDSFFLGNHSFKNVVAAPTNAGRSRIGRGLFNYGIVTMDYPNRTFYLTPYRELVYDTVKNFGISYLENNGKLVIATVWDNTEADKKGLKPGFEIIQFGNFLPFSKATCDWPAALRKEASTQELQILYRDEKGRQKEIKLTQKEFTHFSSSIKSIQ